MKILHVASFLGNIGDNASHIGLNYILDDVLESYDIKQLEIRKFYKNYQKHDKMFFDKEFVKLVNTFDMCFIGGGGFLDYWVDNSQTGTTIDIFPDYLLDISKPLIFTSIGSNPHKKIPAGNINKYKNFLEKASENKKILFAFRNDGSIVSVKNDLGKKYVQNITEILDHGFFYKINLKLPRIVDQKYVAINITDDQIKMLSSIRTDFNIDSYYRELKIILEFIVNSEKLHIVLVPHIFSDLKAISNLLDYLDDNLIRNSITVSQCIQGNRGADYSFSIYEKSEYVIATRFHSNVCSLALGKYTIGLVALERINYLYKSLKLNQNAVKLKKNFSENVILRIKNRKAINKTFLQTKMLETKSFYHDLFKSHLS